MERFVCGNVFIQEMSQYKMVNMERKKAFYNFNKNHHRKVHDHQPYKIQIVSRLTMNKHQYLKEYRLINHRQQHSPFPYIKPSNYFLCNTQRSINLMNIIFDDFLGIHICKKPLNAYLIQELIHLAMQFKINHHYLFKKPPVSFKKSYDAKLVYRQIIRNQQQFIQSQAQQLTITNHASNNSPTPTIEVISDEDGDLQMSHLTPICTLSPTNDIDVTIPFSLVFTLFSSLCFIFKNCIHLRFIFLYL